MLIKWLFLFLFAGNSEQVTEVQSGNSNSTGEGESLNLLRSKPSRRTHGTDGSLIATPTESSERQQETVRRSFETQ